MIEAVGRRNLKAYFQAVHRLLKDDGLFLIQAISSDSFSLKSNRRLDQFLLWITKYIFPNGYLPNLRHLSQPARDQFIIRHWENFGPDYDKTLMAWSRNFNRAWPTLRGRYDERFKRCWNFYLSSCAALFRANMVQLYQVVYAKADNEKCLPNRSVLDGSCFSILPYLL